MKRMRKTGARIPEWKTRWTLARGIRHAVACAKARPLDTAVDDVFSEDAKEIAPCPYREELVLPAKEMEARRPRRKGGP